jgi:uncharacterized cupin superfamily protein
MTQAPLSAADVPVIHRKSLYPEPFASLVEGRVRRRLGDLFGLTRFGVNLTQLAPGSISALFHHHSKQDEFIYILEGSPTLVLGEQEYVLKPGDCCGFQAGSGMGHQLINRSTSTVVYLEVGDRTAGDEPEYPRDDLKLTQSAEGAWIVTHKDGRPY